MILGYKFSILNPNATFIISFPPFFITNPPLAPSLVQPPTLLSPCVSDRTPFSLEPFADRWPRLLGGGVGDHGEGPLHPPPGPRRPGPSPPLLPPSVGIPVLGRSGIRRAGLGAVPSIVPIFSKFSIGIRGFKNNPGQTTDLFERFRLFEIFNVMVPHFVSG